MSGSPGQGLKTREARRLVLPVVRATVGLRPPATVIRADAGYHSDANLKPLVEAKIGPLSPRGDRYSAIPAPTSDWIAPCAGAARWTGKGNLTGWFTTSRSWCIRVMRDELGDEKA